MNTIHEPAESNFHEERLQRELHDEKVKEDEMDDDAGMERETEEQLPEPVAGLDR